MSGTLEPVSPQYITPKKTRLGETSPDYSSARPVAITPISNVPEAAIANSMQEDYERKMEQAGQSRRRSRLTRKTHKKTRKPRKAHKKSRKSKSRKSRKSRK